MERKAEASVFSITPVQPYLAMEAENYQRVLTEMDGISHFYEFTVKSGMPTDFQAVPDGSVDLWFGIGKKDVKTSIGGTVLKVKKWQMDAGRVYFGVRFQPGKCILPEELGIQDIINQDVEIDGNWYGDGILEKLAKTESLPERSRIFFEEYKKRIKEKSREDAFRRLESYLCSRIYESKGKISIQELATETGYSPCYIRRIFGSIHGISPKMFETFVRFQNVLREMEKKEMRLEELALECGYYDQSHMMKDFKNFSGITPEAYRKLVQAKKLKVFG